MTDSITPNVPDEIWELLEALCEDRMTPAQGQRLDELVVGDETTRRLYVDYMMLHGSLHWDAATTDASSTGTAAPEITSTASGIGDRNAHRWVVLALSACLLVGLGAMAQRMLFSGSSLPENTEVTDKTGRSTPGRSDVVRNDRSRANPKRTPERTNRRDFVGTPVQPKVNSSRKHAAKRIPAFAPRPRQREVVIPEGGSSLDAVVAYVDHRAEARWREEGVRPSATAADGTWLRRATLDIIGRIPTVEEAERFLADENPAKRRFAIDRLLGSTQYVRNWTAIWSNLLVGRKPSADVDIAALEKFLRDSFAQNRPWKEVVVDLVSAQGDGSENGAANFLIAHLNNEAVPATAITARLFLGTQVQCTQCHDHPFNNWKQSQFWELNGFFKQTVTVRRKPASKNGKRRVELVNREVGGPLYYPTRREILMAAFPRFDGRRIDAAPQVNRRAELARLIFESEKKLVARAMVNRMWAHFFGYGFTVRVDDMGPHRPPTHPELLDRLAGEFVQSGYDVKRLIRWICNSRPYQLSSRFNDTNGDDNPSTGLPPSFSRMYVKAMSAEQLYDSLMVATRADRAGAGNWGDVARQRQRQRQRWLQQFVVSFDTDENDEATTFDGTIPQALLLMNSKLVQNAVSTKPGTFFHSVVSSSRPEKAKVRLLALAALSREPTQRESAVFRKALSRPAPRGIKRRLAKSETLQDIFWAFLNSNEFILIH